MKRLNITVSALVLVPDDYKVEGDLVIGPDGTLGHPTVAFENGYGWAVPNDDEPFTYTVERGSTDFTTEIISENPKED